MLVRSLRSSVLQWPDAKTVTEAVRCWAQRVACRHPEVVRIGYLWLVRPGQRVFVYTSAEWQAPSGRFRQTLDREVVWVYTTEEHA